MKKEFVPNKQALDLKEIEFDEPCFGYYKPNGELDYIENHILKDFPYLAKNSEWQDLVAAPTFSQAFRWFREKYNLRGFIGFRPNVKQFDCHVYDMSLSGKEYVKQRTMEEFNKDPKVGTYEEAELECLKKLIEIVKSK